MQKNLPPWRKRRWSTSVSSTTDWNPPSRYARTLSVYSFPEAFSKLTMASQYNAVGPRHSFSMRSEPMSLPISMERPNLSNSFTSVCRGTNNFRKVSQFLRNTFQADSQIQGCVHSQRG